MVTAEDRAGTVDLDAELGAEEAVVLGPLAVAGVARHPCRQACLAIRLDTACGHAHAGGRLGEMPVVDDGEESSDRTEVQLPEQLLVVSGGVAVVGHRATGSALMSGAKGLQDNRKEYRWSFQRARQ
ncbi:hypothetical protein [Nonomuraea sp. NEAU-A123]|uniref:hypothetical protein n=1 Tax=Nonomuraea sp. NEAU-A123 TaxID=2839649 RepID=UPI001BE45DA0|nr:hypothetical protein [Nonomuraea sp. NEAU-A123]MBT2232983.1 hypothetical protein [Nonomuraea sp. NEAU-A123]